MREVSITGYDNFSHYAKHSAEVLRQLNILLHSRTTPTLSFNEVMSEESAYVTNTDSVTVAIRMTLLVRIIDVIFDVSEVIINEAKEV